MSYRSQFSDAPMFDKFGVVTGTSSTGVQMPNDPCNAVRFKAHPNNIGIFLLGEAGSGLTSYPLDAGDDTGWIYTSNTNRYLHSNVSGSTDQLLYWLLK
jgi:hypothetical protein